MWAALFLLPLICLQAVLLPADELFHDGHAQGAELGAGDGLGTTGLELLGHNAQVNGIAHNVLGPGGGSLAGKLAGLLTAWDDVVVAVLVVMALDVAELILVHGTGAAAVSDLSGSGGDLNSGDVGIAVVPI